MSNNKQNELETLQTILTAIDALPIPELCPAIYADHESKYSALGAVGRLYGFGYDEIVAYCGHESNYEIMICDEFREFLESFHQPTIEYINALYPWSNQYDVNGKIVYSLENPYYSGQERFVLIRNHLINGIQKFNLVRS